MARRAASAELQEQRLVLAGALLRPAVATLWPRVSRAAAVEAIDLTAVDAVDSAGVALLGWLADRWLGTGFLLPVGMLAGMALSLYVVWLRYGKP